VLVRIVKRMVHPIDSLLIRGIVPAPLPAGGAIPGGDGVGIVEQVGSGVNKSTGIIPGARVGLVHVHGTWAERTIAPATSLIPLPHSVSDEVACQVCINGITAIMLMRAALAADSGAGSASPLLVTAAGSGIGRNVIALARLRGTTVVALVRSEAGAAILARIFDGLPVVVSDREGWPASVAAAYGPSPSVVLDPIGGEMTRHLLGVLANGGTLLTYGMLDPRPTVLPTVPMIMRELAIRGVEAPSWLTRTSAEQRAADIAELFEMTRRAAPNFAEYRELPLSDAVNALSAAQATPRRGATILTTAG
jgi:NADPH:quinone reductase-like Zn-dependent oxidoreductase